MLISRVAGDQSLRLHPATILRAALLIILGLQVASGVSRIYLRLSGDKGMSASMLQLLDVDKEQSLPTWFSILAIFTAAALAAVIAFRTREQNGSHFQDWVVATGILLAMSLDEQVGVHERTVHTMRHLLNVSEGPFYYAWVVPGMAVVVVVLITMSRFAFRLPASTRNRLAVAAAVYVAGAIGVEMLYPALYATAFGESDFAVTVAPIFPALEETGEMVGIALVIWALSHHLNDMKPGVKVVAPS